MTIMLKLADSGQVQELTPSFELKSDPLLLWAFEDRKKWDWMLFIRHALPLLPLYYSTFFLPPSPVFLLLPLISQICLFYLSLCTLFSLLLYA